MWQVRLQCPYHIIASIARIPNTMQSVANTSPQRFKDAVDSRIQEEQARQRTTATGPSRSASTRQRSGSRNISPSRRRARRDPDGTDKAVMPTGREPDPSEFEPEFVIGEEGDISTPSRAGTPAQTVSTSGPAVASSSAAQGSPANDSSNGEAGSTGAEGEATAATNEIGSNDQGEKGEKKADAPTTPQELPQEVRQRLRKLDRLEPKYSGWLQCIRREYRTDTNIMYRTTQVVPNSSR